MKYEERSFLFKIEEKRCNKKVKKVQSSMIAVLSISALKVLWFIEFSLYMAQRKIFLKFLSQHFSWKKEPLFLYGP